MKLVHNLELLKDYHLTPDHRLARKGVIVSSKRGNRIYAYAKGQHHDAAAIVFALHFGFWPSMRLRFLDGNPENLRLENLVMAHNSSDKAKMLQEHSANLVKCRAMLESWQLSPRPSARVAEATERRKLPVSAGCMHYRHKGLLYELPLAEHVGDDVVMRLQRHLAAGGKPLKE